MVSKEYVVGMKHITGGHLRMCTKLDDTDIIISPTYLNDIYCKIICKSDQKDKFPIIREVGSEISIVRINKTDENETKNIVMLATHPHMCFSFSFEQERSAVTISDTRIKNISICGNKNKHIITVQDSGEDVVVTVKGIENRVILFVPDSYECVIVDDKGTNSVSVQHEGGSSRHTVYVHIIGACNSFIAKNTNHK